MDSHSGHAALGPREMAHRIALARSILNQRHWSWQDEPHVRDVLAALDGCGIAEILRRAG